ncbi:MAG: hypothetical protein MJ082_02375 [Clostridia bacterium]|nr:hypothetical protein [Clostridia bacterium]
MKSIWKSIVIEIGKIIACLSGIPFLLVKQFHEVGSFPYAEGNATLRRDFYYSIADKFSTDNLSLGKPVAVLCISVIVSILFLLWNKSNRIRKVSNIIFAIYLLTMVLTYLTAASVHRYY